MRGKPGLLNESISDLGTSPGQHAVLPKHAITTRDGQCSSPDLPLSHAVVIDGGSVWRARIGARENESAWKNCHGSPRPRSGDRGSEHRTAKYVLMYVGMYIYECTWRNNEAIPS
jgi:hypothetical protein